MSVISSIFFLEIKTPKENENKTQIPRFAAFLAKRKQETESKSNPLTPGTRPATVPFMFTWHEMSWLMQNITFIIYNHKLGVGG